MRKLRQASAPKSALNRARAQRHYAAASAQGNGPLQLAMAADTMPTETNVGLKRLT